MTLGYCEQLGVEGTGEDSEGQGGEKQKGRLVREVPVEAASTKRCWTCGLRLGQR